jgi:hypothetical protein
LPNRECSARPSNPRPESPGEFDLPIDIDTGAIVDDVWRRWLAFDPIHRLEEPSTRQALKRLRSLHLTASTRDEWYLDLAARQFAGRGRELGLEVTLEEFEGGHFDKGPRFEAMYRRMLAALSSE